MKESGYRRNDQQTAVKRRRDLVMRMQQARELIDDEEQEQQEPQKEWIMPELDTEEPGNTHEQETNVVDPAVQAHLQKEFDVYADHKMEMIDKGEDIIPADQKKDLTKDEKKERFLNKKNLFQKRMTGRKHTFWGTKKYNRLLDKWFPDYGPVIAHKVSSIKNEIDKSVTETNERIAEIISRLREAIGVADTDTAKALQLIGEADKCLLKASEQKQKAGATLEEYGKDKRGEYMTRYDAVLLRYKSLIAVLTSNVDAIRQDKSRFENVIARLSDQQDLLNKFEAEVAGTSDVLILADMQKNEFAGLISNADKIILELNNTGRTTAAVDEIQTQEELKTGENEIGTLDAEVEDIRQKEMLRREEERRKKEEAERLRKAEADRLKREADAKKKKDADAGNVPSVFIKKTDILITAPGNGPKTQGADILKSRKGKDYTRETWSPTGVAKDAQTNIDESGFSAKDKAFFIQYKITCDSYLADFYKGKTGTNKLTGDMFVNAAKRIYIKYKDLSYIVPAEMVMVQGRTESGLGTKGANPYNNPFNVGETDKGRKPWVKDMTSPEIGIFFYMDLLANDYLSNKTADQLLESYVNEKGSRYASSPRYEMHLKAGMGQVGLVRDGKRPAVSVGKNYEKNDTSESAAFVRGMLSRLGYKQAKLGDAVEAFQSERMYPPLTAAQQRRVDNMNAGDRHNFEEGEAKGIDGSANPKANTVGLLYYLTYMGNTVTDFSGKGTVVTVKTGTNKVRELYDKYKKDEDMVALGKALIPYCKYFAEDVLQVFDDLGWNTEDNLAYVLAVKSTDIILSNFDAKLLKRMKEDLDPANNMFSVELKKIQWERVKKAMTGSKPDVKPVENKKKDVQNVKRKTIAVNFSITGSVGAGGNNMAEDVKKIQDLLINFNYLKENDSEVNLVAQTVKDKPGTKLNDSQLTNTIAAIRQFQKYGATTGETLSVQDGKVDKSGGTITAMRELNRVDVNYRDQKYEEDIPNVLSASQWVSQFRYGYNFKDKEDNAEEKYVNFVKQETGLADPADLGSADESKIKTVKDEFAGKATWFDQKKTLAEHGLRMNQKARSYKPNYVCCWDAANTMLDFSGASDKGAGYKIQTYVADLVSYTVKDKKGKDVVKLKVENGKYTNQLPLGIKYIDSQLKAGKAVFVGVERGAAKTQNEHVTDHYIIIVGKHKDDKNNYYYNYFDPGTSNNGYDTTKNRLAIADDKNSVENSSYKLSQIRTNNE